MDKEIRLAGGNANACVVRVGDTVRRQQSKASPTVQRLLKHLEETGFSACPRFLGIDAKGREILSYIDGEAGFTDTLWQRDTPLVAGGKLLRDLHDATRSFDHADDDAWAMRQTDPDGCDVICHNDFAPYNLIFRSGMPVAVIDFDLAGPGPRLWDVAYGAYWLTPLAFAAPDLRHIARRDLRGGSPRLKAFCRSYGVPADPVLLDTVQRVLAHMADPEAVAEAVGKNACESLKAAGHFSHWRDEHDAFCNVRDELLRNLH